MSHRILTVLTSETPEAIVEAGGSQAWKLDFQKARGCSHLVAIRNNPSKGANSGMHRGVFIVGKIRSVTPCEKRPDRKFVHFSEYTLVSPKIPLWSGASYSLRYVDNLADIQIEESALDWLPMPVQPDTVQNRSKIDNDRR